MKTLIKLMYLLSLFSMVNGCSKQDEILNENDSALQLISADNLTVRCWFQPTQEQWYCPVMCNEETVDFLVADGESITIHAVGQLVNGAVKKVEYTVFGTIVCQLINKRYKHFCPFHVVGISISEVLNTLFFIHPGCQVKHE